MGLLSAVRALCLEVAACLRFDSTIVQASELMGDVTPGWEFSDAPQQLLTSARMIQEQGPATSRFRNAPPKTKISGEATGKLLSPVIYAIPHHIGGTPRPPTMDHTVGELAASPSK